MVFDDPECLYDPTAHARSGKLIEAILGETDILQKLQEHPSFQKMPEQAPPLNIYCGELTALEVTPSFGPYSQLLEFDSLNLSHPSRHQEASPKATIITSKPYCTNPSAG